MSIWWMEGIIGVAVFVAIWLALVVTVQYAVSRIAQNIESATWHYRIAYGAILFSPMLLNADLTVRIGGVLALFFPAWASYDISVVNFYKAIHDKRLEQDMERELHQSD